MGKKIIYFVRHGETVLNAKGIRQGADGGLTDKGREQAAATAKRFPKEKGSPQVIIASPYERTVETANIIAKELGIKVEFSPLLVERRNPSEIVGRSGDDPEVKKIVDKIDKSFHSDDLRFSDEENFADLKERARELLLYIRSRGEKRMIMVTHKIFLQMIVAYMIYGEKLDASHYNELTFFNPVNNAGMTIVEYVPHWFKADEWKLLTWNDQA